MTKVQAANMVKRHGKEILVSIVGDQTGPSIAGLKADIIRLTDETMFKKLNVLINLDGVTASDDAAAEEARAFFDGLPYRRIAIYGGSPLVSMSTKVMMRFLVNTDHVKIFRTEQQARDWLDSSSTLQRAKHRLSFSR
jgi:hypothetical protein